MGHDTLGWQAWLVWVHAVNLASNLLGNDVISCALRKLFLRLVGTQLGPHSTFYGGGYVYGRGLSSGACCFVNRDCYFDLTAPISLGADVVVGHGVMFITARHELGPSTRRAGPVEGRPITVEDGAWLGAGCKLLPGTRIGRGAVVATGAVVTGDVAPDTFVAGVPAAPIRALPAG